ncbi:MAG: RlmE family RNA methyltransferase [Betaproteobacteria bacterium]|nr:MAG: RlmE family RNA methyltransferase [Betaproteobacteria bacterium]TMG78776.1 MAG: RlmE family RNA methyltransferase [Betaproteobacteria bacterium]
MARSKSSKAWLKRHVNDPYVHRAKAHGYRSRAAYKLIEIAKRDRLLSPGAAVVDLGAAPGGWAQALAERAGRAGRVIAVDLLEIAPIPGVTIVRGDFGDEAVLKRIEAVLDGRKLDLVVSDMAPNLSGVSATDQARSIRLCELALEFARSHLKPQGAFLVKVFQGSGYPEFLAAMREAFVEVASRKPGASRSGSSEMYLLGKRLKGGH